MSLTSIRLADLRKHWFLPLVAALIAMVWMMPVPSGAQGRQWEAVVLFDVLVSIPLLFLLCYRHRLKRWQLIARIVGLQCLGIWVASQLVVEDQQYLLPHLAIPRIAGLVVLGLIELKLLVTVVGLVFRQETKVDQLVERGVPRWIARLMLLEARFWRWVLSLVKR